MTLNFFITGFLFLGSLILLGWVLFSFGAGLIVYLSTSTTDHASIEPKKLTEAEGKSVLYAHTKDPRIMDCLNAAKERWLIMRDNHTFECWSIKSREGLYLSGYFWTAPGEILSNKTVVIVHGMMDSAAGMGYLAEEYHSRGWNVFSIDLRSHGESEGTKRTMGVKEAEDVSLWMTQLIEKKPDQRILLHGISMGAATVLLYAGRKKLIPAEIKGIIADSSFARYDISFNRLVFMAVGNQIVAWSITHGASLASALLCGVPFWSMNPSAAIRNINIPVLYFHGQKDLLVPIGMVRKMFVEALKRGEETVVIPEAPHIGPYFYAPGLYMRKIEDFFGRSE